LVTVLTYVVSTMLMLTPSCIGGSVVHSVRCLVGRVLLDACFFTGCCWCPTLSCWAIVCVIGWLIPDDYGWNIVSEIEPWGHPRSGMGYEVLIAC
jgi:hypothetical protein